MNGAMAIDQEHEGAAQTITAAAAKAYTVDQWYAYCTGADVTGQRVAGSGNTQYRYQFTGAASNTAIQFGQRIESTNCHNLAGKTATLSVDLANSLLATVTWTAYYANTTDTFGTIASPTRTQIATGTFTVDGTVTRYEVQIDIPSAATTGLEIVFSVANQTSGTWTIGDAQFEVGDNATEFEYRPYDLELSLCQRYLQKFGSASGGVRLATGQAHAIGQARVCLPYQKPMRATPSLIFSATSDFALTKANETTLGAITLGIANTGINSCTLTVFCSPAELVAGDATQLITLGTDKYFYLSARL